MKPGQKMQQIGRLTANPRTLQWEALRRNPATGEVSVADSFTLVRDGAPPTAPAPSIALSKELTWTCANADTAMASGSWSGVRPTSGSEVVGNGVFTLQCSGDGGHSSTTVTIEQGVP